MKRLSNHLRLPILLCISIVSLNTGYGQTTGRVFINEYLPWTSNGCGPNAEFVELMNFGPGPVNIGCYILTNGSHSITIPHNTILDVGQFYVLSGEDIVPTPCANIDSTIHPNLNWNTCNCTNSSINGPDGFLSDGTVVNEKLVLLDPDLNVIDAVARDLPVTPSATLTTPASNGCSSKTFNLDSMSMRYETLGMSTGRGNSFARTIDGDCQWVKDPQQSAGATNNRTSKSSNVTYSITITQALDCDSTPGSISIYVQTSDYSSIFPMNYILALDSNNNGIFDLNDLYINGIDSTPTTIRIDNLAAGHYRITVASINGCYLKSFDFTILPCYPILATKLVYIKFNSESDKLEWMLTDVENISSIIVEEAKGVNEFIEDQTIYVEGSGSKYFSALVDASLYKYFRLKILGKDGKEFYSPIISSDLSSSKKINKFWPNPATEKLNVQLTSTENKKAHYSIFNVNGAAVQQGIIELSQGLNRLSVPVSSLLPGVYQILINDLSADGHVNSFKFVKH